MVLTTTKSLETSRYADATPNVTILFYFKTRQTADVQIGNKETHPCSYAYKAEKHTEKNEANATTLHGGENTKPCVDWKSVPTHNSTLTAIVDEAFRLKTQQAAGTPTTFSCFTISLSNSTSCSSIHAHRKQDREHGDTSIKMLCVK